MSRIQKVASLQNLKLFDTFIEDVDVTSKYFEIRELESILTGGRNAFLITGTEFLQGDTEIRVEVLDVNGNPIYVQPGKGIPQYYEGTAKVIGIYIYEDTPIGLGQVTILGELKQYEDDSGLVQDVPSQWENTYNVRWSKSVYINRNLPNETKVRFFKRPVIAVTEILKPIFTRTVTDMSSSGDISGVPISPEISEDFRLYNSETTYRLETTSSFFTASMEGKDLTVTGLPRFNDSGTYVTEVRDILTDTVALARTPYYKTSSLDSSQLVSSFANQQGSIVYDSDPIYGNVDFTGSFQNIKLIRLNTFVGDVFRVKLYRKSLNRPGDFELVTDQQLEATEILKDFSSRDLEERTGYFSNQNIITNFWVSESLADAPASPIISALYDSSVLLDSVRISGSAEPNSGSLPRYLFRTQDEFIVSDDSEYTLTLNAIGRRPTTTIDGKLEIYLSGSAFTGPESNTFGKLVEVLTISGSGTGEYGYFENFERNIAADSEGSGSLVFVSYFGVWNVSDISLKVATETSFSPDEVSFILPISPDIQNETFKFKAEFFDINNNNIPVTVESDPIVFNAGSGPDQTKIFILTGDAAGFRFNSGSVPEPLSQTINFTVTRNSLTGSTLWESQSYDSSGILIIPASPLTNIADTSATLTVANFTGSGNNIVQTVYTASTEGYSDATTVFKFTESAGSKIVNLSVDTQIFTFDGNTTDPEPTEQTASFTANLQNVASPATWTASNDLGADVTSELVGSGNNRDLYVSSFSPATSSIKVTAESEGVSDFITINRLDSGQDGTGASAKIVTVVTNKYIFTFDGNTQLPEPAAQTASFSASIENITGSSVSWSFVNDSGLAVDNLYYSTGSDNTGDLYVDAFTPATESVTVTVSLSGRQDKVSVTRVDSGQDGINGFLTNESHTIGTAYDGTGGDYTGASGSFKVFASFTDVSLSSSFALFATSSGLSAGISSIGKYSASLSDSADSGSATFRATYNGLDLDKVFSLAKSKAGFDAFVVFSTNENHTFAADKDGNVTDYSGGNSLIKVFAGTEAISYNQTPTNNTFRTGSVLATNVTQDTSLTPPTFGITDMSADSGSLDIPIIYRNKIGNDASATHSISYSKSRIGQDGTDAKLIRINASTNTFTYDGSTGVDVASPTAQTASFTSSRENIVAPTTWSAADQSGNDRTSALQGSGDNRDLLISSFNASTQSIKITATAEGFTDNATVVRVSSGASGSDGVSGSDGLVYYIKPLNGRSFSTNPNTNTTTPSVLEFQMQKVLGSTLTTEPSSSVFGLFFSSSDSAVPTASGDNSLFQVVPADINIIDSLTMKSASVILDTIDVTDITDGLSGSNAVFGVLDVYGVIAYVSSSTSGWNQTTDTTMTASFYTGPTKTSQELVKVVLNQSNKSISGSVDVDSAEITTTISGNDSREVSIKFVSASARVQESFYVVTDGDDGTPGTSGSDGVDSLSVSLTKPATSYPADIDGNVAASTFRSGDSQVEVLLGSVAKTYNSTASSDSFRFGTLVAVNSTVSQSVPPIAQVGITAMTEDSASLEVPVIYRDAAGADFPTVTVKASYTKSRKGTQGPGVLYIGDYFEVSSSNPNRPLNNDVDTRDVVSSGSDFPNNYYIFTGSDATTIHNAGSPPGASWTLMNSFSSVATDILLAQDAYIKKTLSVGTNASGSNANIKLVGGTAFPYISLGQTSEGYNQDGIFAGNDASAYKLSLISASNGLTWDGSALSITGGTIDIGSGSFTVDANGNLTANTGSFAGELSASGGSFGAITGGSIDIGSGLFTVDSSGVMSASAGYFSGEISADSIVAAQDFTTTGSLFLTGSLNVYGGTLGGLGFSGSVGNTLPVFFSNKAITIIRSGTYSAWSQLQFQRGGVGSYPLSFTIISDADVIRFENPIVGASRNTNDATTAYDFYGTMTGSFTGDGSGLTSVPAPAGMYIQANSGLSGGGTILSGGTGSLDVDFSNLTNATPPLSGSDWLVVVDEPANASRKAAVSLIPLSEFDNDANWTANAGDITQVNITAGTALTGTKNTTSGNHIQTLNLDLSALTLSSIDGDGDYFVVVDSFNVQRRLAKANIKLSGFNDDLPHITSVNITAGLGLIGSVNTTSGAHVQTLNLDLNGLGPAGVLIDTDYLAVVDGATSKLAQIKDINLGIFKNDQNWDVGTVTSITIAAGTALTGGGTITTSGTATLNLDLNLLTTSISNTHGDFFVVVDSLGAQRKLTKANIQLGGFNNNVGWTTNTGTVTSVGVTAGFGLSGGGTVTTAGSINLAVAFNELGASGTLIGTDDLVVIDGSTSAKTQINTIPLSIFSNDSNWDVGTVTSITINAGVGLTGNATITSAGTVYLAVGAGTNMIGNANDIALNASISLSSVSCTGDVTSNTSDIRLKTNILPIKNALHKVNSLRGFTYNWTDKAIELGAGFKIDDRRAGLFAQDVQKILPEATITAPLDREYLDDDLVEYNSKSGKNYLSIRDEQLIPLLVEAIKELTERLEKLEEENK